MSRFRNVPNAEILASRFKLSEVQEMVARQHGFDSRQALKTGRSTTSRKLQPLPSKARIVSRDHANVSVRVKAFLFVFSYGSPPCYAQVGHDGARLNSGVSSFRRTFRYRSRRFLRFLNRIFPWPV